MKTKYALMALNTLARASEREGMVIAEVARAENIPKKFLEAILLALKNHGILNSRRGPGGGYTLARPANQVTIGSIVRALEGDLAPIQCLSETAHATCPECADEDTCGIKLIMVEVKDAIASAFDAVTLADMLHRSDFARQKKAQRLDYAI